MWSHAEPRPAGPRERRQDRQIRCRATWIDGVPCQPLAAAIACAAQTMGADRALEAASEALRMGYLNAGEKKEIEEKIER